MTLCGQVMTRVRGALCLREVREVLTPRDCALLGVAASRLHPDDIERTLLPLLNTIGLRIETLLCCDLASGCVFCNDIAHHVAFNYEVDLTWPFGVAIRRSLATCARRAACAKAADADVERFRIVLLTSAGSDCRHQRRHSSTAKHDCSHCQRSVARCDARPRTHRLALCPSCAGQRRARLCSSSARSRLTLFRCSTTTRSCDICLDADAAAYCSIECAHAAWPAHWPTCCPQIDQCVVVAAVGQRDETLEPEQVAMQWQSNGLSRSSDDGDDDSSVLTSDEVNRRTLCTAQRSAPLRTIRDLGNASRDNHAIPLHSLRRAAADDDAVWPTLCETGGDIWRTRR